MAFPFDTAGATIPVRQSKIPTYRDRFLSDVIYGAIYPVMMKFTLPGSFYKLNIKSFLRYQPMVAPPLNGATARFRLCWVPLRQIEPNSELIITGSKDGHFDSDTVIPKFESVFDISQGQAEVKKHSFSEILGLPVGLNTNNAIDSVKGAFSPALYWYKGYNKIWWDVYRDENLFTNFETFDEFWDEQKLWCNDSDLNKGLQFSYLPKNYFTSALPWQMKGIVPTIALSGNLSFANTELFRGQEGFSDLNPIGGDSRNPIQPNLQQPFSVSAEASGMSISFEQQVANLNQKARMQLEKGTTTGFSFNADDFRTMMAQTRVFEQLARTGSRYVEFLRSMFGTAPRDDTLQRAVYLGGCKVPIITTEVIQTAEDGTNPVGTMRGHGITSSSDTLSTPMFKEYGLLYLLMDILPDISFTQGVNRQFSYKSRFDFPIPAFQHLSEQEIRRGELYVDYPRQGQSTVTPNDNTFGFTEMYNELRTGRTFIGGSFKDTLRYWHQGIIFDSVPNLNNAFIDSSSYLEQFNRIFNVVESDTYPILADVNIFVDSVLPLDKRSTPGTRR